MKTIKELTIEANNFLTQKTAESHAVTVILTKEVIPVFKELEIKDESLCLMIAGYVECAYSLQPEIEHLKKQYDIKCDEKRESDQQIERLTRIIIEGGLGSKLEID